MTLLALWADCDGTRAEPVTREGQPDGNTIAPWTDENMPQVLQ